MANGRVAARGRSAAGRLSREAIVSSALSLADAEGLDAVTIRRLARDHDVTPMALYWHFRDKEALLDGMVERVLSKVEIPTYPDGGQPAWDARLADLFAALVDGLRRHPEIAELVHTRLLGSEAGLALSEVCFAALAEAGFAGDVTGLIGAHALHTIVVLVTMAPGERRLMQTDEDILRRARERRAHLDALEPDRYPHVIACAPALVSAPDEE